MESVQMEVKENVDDNLFTEGVLYDVLDKIFQFLSLKDLCRAAAVCKSWHHIVKIEISKRNDIESLTLPITYDSDDSDDEDYDTFKYLQNKWHLSNFLRSLPCFILLFHDETFTYRKDNEHFYLHYNRFVKKEISYGCFETFGLSLNTTEVHTANNVGIGVTIPSTNKLKVDWYVPYDSDITNHSKNSTMTQLTDKVVGSLISPGDEHNCFIFLRNQSDAVEGEMISNSNSFLAEFSNSLYRRCEPGSYSLWGGGVSEITYSGYGRNDFVWLIIVRISGLALHSCSIVLKLSLSDTQVETELINLKKDICLKSNSVALAMVPSTENDTFQQKLRKTEIFRRIFSNIPLVCVYEKTQFTQIGVNSMRSDPHPLIEHKNSIVYLILSTE